MNRIDTIVTTVLSTEWVYYTTVTPFWVNQSVLSVVYAIYYKA